MRKIRKNIIKESIEATKAQKELEKQTLTGTSMRKHALQLQFSLHTGQASAKASFGILGYLTYETKMEKFQKCRKIDSKVVRKIQKEV